MRQAVAVYREDNDWLSNFITTCCDVGKELEQPSGKFYEAYRSYCNLTGEQFRDSATFYGALDQAGFQRVRHTAGRFIKGLQLKDDALGDVLNN